MDKKYITTPYQRKAYKSYYDRKTKEKIIDENGVEMPNPFYDPAFKEKRKESAKKYYLANREKVLARMANKKDSSDSE
jgi:hypothetical protein